jgi:periplasmic mercuric ion binding protein
MKKALIALSAVVALGLAGSLAPNLSQTAWADSETAQAAEQTQTFTVEKMTCATCPIAVKKAMSRVDGVHSVTVDYDTKTAVAVFDPAQTSAKAIADASTGVGYPATPISD